MMLVMSKTNVPDEAALAIARRLEEVAMNLRCGAIGAVSFVEEVGRVSGWHRFKITTAPLNGPQRGRLCFDGDGCPCADAEPPREEADHA